MCRRKEVSEAKSNPGIILRQPCRYYLKGTCTRSLCENWHPPRCQFYKTETGCKAGDKCLFPHHKVHEQPNKKPKKTYHSKKGRESDDNNAVAIVRIVPQWGCVSQDSESLDSQRGKTVPGEPDAKSLVLEQILRVRFTQSTLRLARIGGKTMEHRLEKYKSNFLISEVPYAIKFEDRSQEETARQQRCAQSKAWNLDKIIHKLKEKDKTTFYSPSEEWVLPVTSKKRAGRKIVCCGFQSKVCTMVSKKDLNSAELETMRISRNPTTVMTANGEVQTREEATVYVKELDLFVTLMLLEETPRSSFALEALRGS